MKKNATVVVSKKENNQVVTNMYLNTISQMLKKAGYNCTKVNDLSSCNKQTDYLVFDNCKEAMKFWLKGYKNIIIWIQGVVPEERLMMKQPKIKYYIHSFIEKVMLRNSKFLFMVSNEMLSHYHNKYKLNLDYKTYIMPCFNENSVDLSSFYDEKYKKNTFLYAGSLQEWQCFKETIKIYKEIEEKISNTNFIVYTNEQSKAVKLLKKYNVKNFAVSYAKPQDLGKKIKDIKYGFVLRKDDIVNRVATPTKLSNYLSHGIIPIFSPCLMSFNEYNQKNKIAIPLDLEHPNEGIKNIINFSAQKIDPLNLEEKYLQVFRTYYNQKKYISLGAEKLKSILCDTNRL